MLGKWLGEWEGLWVKACLLFEASLTCFVRERQTDHICANDGGTKTLLDLAQLCIQCRWERVGQSEWGERRGG